MNKENINNIDKNKYNIFYEPDLKVDESYQTIADISNEVADSNIENNTNTIVRNAKDKLDNINITRMAVPSYINSLIDGPLKVIEGIINTIDDNSGSKLPDNEINIDNTTNIDNEDFSGSDDYPENPFDEVIPDDIVIKYTDNDKVDVIKSEYDYDLVSIIDDYIDNINSTINKVRYEMVSVLQGLSSNDILKITSDYSIDSSSVEADFRHLSDLVNRSKIGRDARTRMYNKLFNADRTINHIRICKAGAMQRMRYYEASYSEEADYDIAVSNRILENSRQMYDDKYKQNFIALYKYLYSGVIVLNECTNMYINELQAKSILKKR